MAGEMTDALKEQILAGQIECTLIWNTQDGNSTGTMITFVWKGGRIWVSTHATQARIAAIRRNPNVTVVVSSSGTGLGRDRCMTLRGQCRVHEDPYACDDFVPDFVSKLAPRSEKGAATLTRMLTEPGQCVLEITPEREVRFDGHAMLTEIFES